MNPPDEPWNASDWSSRCAWCQQEIPEDHAVIGISTKLRTSMVNPEWAGTVQPLRLVVSRKTLPMMVCGEDSPAKREGKDAMFQVCSDECGLALQAALQNEIDLGEIIGGHGATN